MENPLSPTLILLERNVESIMAKGAPFTKEELAILKIYSSWKGGKAGNAGKRNRKAENQRQINGDK